MPFVLAKNENVHIDNNSKIKDILEKNWEDYCLDTHPKSRRMKAIEGENIYGMNTENIRFLINEIVNFFAPEGVYLEVGTLNGSSLLSAALHNQSTRCIGIDNFSELDPEWKNEMTLMENLKKFDNLSNIEFYNMDYREAFQHLSSTENNFKIDVYYFDGPHGYKDEINGLEIALPYLSANCAILVDDVTWFQVDMANKIFLRKHTDFTSAFCIKPNIWQSKTWWNGFHVITRGIKYQHPVA